MKGSDEVRKAYEKPSVKVYDSSEVLEMLGPAQGFGSGGGRSGLATDPFSEALGPGGAASQFDRRR